MHELDNATTPRFLLLLAVSAFVAALIHASVLESGASWIYILIVFWLTTHEMLARTSALLADAGPRAAETTYPRLQQAVTRLCRELGGASSPRIVIAAGAKARTRRRFHPPVHASGSPRRGYLLLSPDRARALDSDLAKPETVEAAVLELLPALILCATRAHWHLDFLGTLARTTLLFTLWYFLWLIGYGLSVEMLIALGPEFDWDLIWQSPHGAWLASLLPESMVAVMTTSNAPVPSAALGAWWLLLVQSLVAALPFLLMGLGLLIWRAMPARDDASALAQRTLARIQARGDLDLSRLTAEATQ